MKPAVFVLALLIVGIVSVMSQSQERTTKVLSYRFDRDGVPFTILAMSFDGACNVTVRRRSPSGPSEATAPMEAATFAKLVAGVAEIPAIASARFTTGSPAVDTETHHIITIFIRGAGDTKSEMYTVPDKDAPEPFRAWLKLLLDAIPKA
jgi:hypothetical protein